MSKQDVLIASTVYFQISFERPFGSINQVAQGAVILGAEPRPLAGYGQTHFPPLSLFRCLFPTFINTQAERAQVAALHIPMAEWRSFFLRIYPLRPDPSQISNPELRLFVLPLTLLLFPAPWSLGPGPTVITPPAAAEEWGLRITAQCRMCLGSGAARMSLSISNAALVMASPVGMGGCAAHLLGKDMMS